MIAKLIGFIVFAAVAANILWFQNFYFGAFIDTTYFALFSFFLGRHFFKKLEQPYQSALGALLLLAIYSISGGILFYTYELSQAVIVGLLTVISILILIPTKDLKTQWPLIAITKDDLLIYLHFTYYFLVAALLFLLFKNSNDNYINSVWTQLPPKFLILYVFALVTLILLNFRNKSKWQYLNIGIFFFLTLNIANFVYSLGFGFDGFVHRATEKLLIESGTISPKPPYYIGYYVLVVIINKISRISLFWIDSLITSLTAFIILPPLVGYGIEKYFKLEPHRIYNYLLLILALPCTLLVQSTPLALGLLLTITGSFLALAYHRDKSIPLWFLFLILIATLSIHAFAAIPLLILLGFILIQKISPVSLKIIATIIWLLTSALAYSAAFIAANGISINKVTIAYHAFDWKIFYLYPYTKQYNYFLDLAYLIGNSILPIAILSAFTFALYCWRTKKQRAVLAFSLTVLALTTNAVILKSFISFESLTGAESNDFIQRILLILPYFTLPCVIALINTVKTSEVWNRIFAGTMLITFILSATYLSFPRYDDYQNSNFINTTVTDYQAVRLAVSEKPYLVLASQATSAAALHLNGFNHNLTLTTGEVVYYYPLPTGGILYPYYLEILHSKNPRDVAEEVKKLTSVEDIFVIVTDAWRNFEEITSRLQTSATNTKIISHATIFQF